ncbi:hypothetical protein ACIPJ2_16205 [Curtobacterium sp. NPDC090217]|uniref:hypothetical protein n=1 Tax=Curtobacterium sp. NPDC090217 TaxID=3363970 RepID=UPI003817BC28
MPLSPQHLNHKQLRVLHWIERGCPDGEYVNDNYGHRITAKALASRGLVRIEGRGRSWSATLTDAGELRVAALKATPPADLPSGWDDAVTGLADRLEAAGGCLDLNDSDDDLDYPKLVWRFNRSESRPRGKELHLTHPNWQNQKQLRLEYRDWFWDEAERPDVPVISTKSHLGTLAKTFLTSKDDQFVTKESLPRAARIIESIVRHAASAGITTRDPRTVDKRRRREGKNARGWSGHVELESGAATLRVQVREQPGAGSEKHDFYSDGEFDRRAYDRIQRLPVWQRNRNYTFVPTGDLELRVTRPGFGFDKSRWKDTRSAKLEERLGELFQQLEVARLEAAARQKQQRQAEERRKRDWEEAMTRARILHRASQEEDLLVEQASIWRRHEEVRAFVDELRRRDDGSDEAVQAWIAAGERVVNRLDAFAALVTPVFPAAAAQDLQPFLSGWSASGPLLR